MARVYLKGLPQLKAKLLRLKEQTGEKVRPAMASAADDLVAMMKRQVPVDHGDLQKSIGWSWGAAPKGSISIGSAKIGDMKITVHAGDEKAFYARWVEFGTKPHINAGEFPGTQNPGTRANPFFFSSYRASKKAMKAKIRKAVQEAVRAAVR